MEFEIKNDNELIEFLKMKDELIYVYDELRFSYDTTLYKALAMVRKRLDYVNETIDKYIKLNDYNRIVCMRNLILEPGEEKEVITNMINDDLENYILSFRGSIPTEGPLKVTYDKSKNGIYIKNTVDRKVYDEYDGGYHYCDSSLTRIIEPAVYQIKEKESIGVAIPKPKVKTKIV